MHRVTEVAYTVLMPVYNANALDTRVQAGAKYELALMYPVLHSYLNVGKVSQLICYMAQLY